MIKEPIATYFLNCLSCHMSTTMINQYKSYKVFDNLIITTREERFESKTFSLKTLGNKLLAINLYYYMTFIRYVDYEKLNYNV